MKRGSDGMKYLKRFIADLLVITLMVVSIVAWLPITGPEGQYEANAADLSEIHVGDHIYMGRRDVQGYTGLPYWRVLDINDDGELLLMSEYLWVGNGSDSDAMIQFNPQAFHYEWAESNAKAWCGGFASAILGDVSGLRIVPTTKSDERFESPDFDNVVYQARENILDGDKVFFLSAEETFTYMRNIEDRVAYLHDGYQKGEAESWWLRSPRWLSELNSVTCAGRVFSEGRIGKNEVYQYSAMRPALWADLSGASISACTHGDATTWVVDPSGSEQTYTKPRFKWAAGNASCTAEAVCKICGATKKETVETTAAVTKEATTEETGVMTYTASFADPLFPVQTKKILIPKKEGAKDQTGPAAIQEITDLAAVKIVKPKAGKKSVTVKWKKVSKKNLKKIKGIEIRCVGPGIDKVVTAGKKASSKKIKGLKSKQTYKVQVRAYNIANGVKHVSKWSKAKRVKVK